MLTADADTEARMEVLNLMSAVMSIMSNAASNEQYRRTGAIPTLAVVHRQLGIGGAPP